MSSLLHRWSSYVIAWRKKHGYSKARFCSNAQIDQRLLRDLEDQHFRSRFYSVASTAEYIRYENLIQQLSGIQVKDPEEYLPLIEKLSVLSPSRRAIVLSHFIEYFDLIRKTQSPDVPQQRKIS